MPHGWDASMVKRDGPTCRLCHGPLLTEDERHDRICETCLDWQSTVRDVRNLTEACHRPVEHPRTRRRDR